MNPVIMTKKILLISALMVIAASCSKRIDAGQEGTGFVLFNCDVSEQVIVTKADAGTKTLPSSVIPGTENLRLEISSSEGIVGTYEKMSLYDQPMMQAGPYNAFFSYGDKEKEGPSAAYFEGSLDFTVVARKTSTETASVALANSVYSLKFSDWFNNYYTDYHIDITTESGLSIAYVGSSSKPLSETSPIFVKAGTKLFFAGYATKTNGVEVQFESTEIVVTKARTWHTVNVNATQVGAITIDITVDDTPVAVEEKLVELNPDA